MDQAHCFHFTFTLNSHAPESGLLVKFPRCFNRIMYIWFVVTNLAIKLTTHISFLLFLYFSLLSSVPFLSSWIIPFSPLSPIWFPWYLHESSTIHWERIGSYLEYRLIPVFHFFSLIHPTFLFFSFSISSFYSVSFLHSLQKVSWTVDQRERSKINEGGASVSSSSSLGSIRLYQSIQIWQCSRWVFRNSVLNHNFDVSLSLSLNKSPTFLQHQATFPLISLSLISNHYHCSPHILHSLFISNFSALSSFSIISHLINSCHISPTGWMSSLRVNWLRHFALKILGLTLLQIGLKGGSTSFLSLSFALLLI